MGYTPVAVERIRSSKVAKPALKTLASLNNAKTSTAVALRDLGRGMDDRVRQEGRVPLKEVVADGTRRWFQDALKEARVGDAAMQVLVGQMHHSGYGVLKNDQKGFNCGWYLIAPDDENLEFVICLDHNSRCTQVMLSGARVCVPHIDPTRQDVSISLAKLEEAYKPEKQTKAIQTENRNQENRSFRLSSKSRGGEQ
ncbi:hypothetical protein MUK42_30563 [Musa troglodytarum]|uniref:Uncharacterized protein n=1 Tax=Musa troglodytarum TaxID=320322 RepID=A0A9E7HWX2_9LILI|nr:hypothetical protein MUK42_30563 [Musa troglodytarum]